MKVRTRNSVYEVTPLGDGRTRIEKVEDLYSGGHPYVGTGRVFVGRLSIPIREGDPLILDLGGDRTLHTTRVLSVEN